MSDRLAKHVKPKLDSARLARQWSVIASRSETSGVRQRPWLALSIAFAAVVLAVVWFAGFRRPAAVATSEPRGVVGVEVSGDSTVFSLADGSRVSAQRGAKLSFAPASPGRTQIDVLAGVADFDVKHDPTRTFVVVAAAVRVVDVGTRFRVEHDEGLVRVSVFEGRVHVERDGRDPSDLGAGASWSTEPTPAVPTSTAETTAQPSVSAAPEQPPPPVARDPDDELLARFAAEHEPSRAFDLVGESGYPRVVPRANPKQLFALGDAARLSGHPREATLAFDALRTKHRSDARAGLAAMELGRIRQDVLHDVSGAEEAYRDALALSPDAPFREDAEARRVEVLEAAGNRDECRKARDAYLTHWPAGVHAAAVSRRCNNP